MVEMDSCNGEGCGSFITTNSQSSMKNGIEVGLQGGRLDCKYHRVQDHAPNSTSVLAGSILKNFSNLQNMKACQKKCNAVGKTGEYFEIANDELAINRMECEGFIVSDEPKDDPQCTLVLRPLTADRKGWQATKKALKDHGWRIDDIEESKKWYRMMAAMLRMSQQYVEDVDDSHIRDSIINEAAKLVYYNELPFGVHAEHLVPRSAIMKIQLDKFVRRNLVDDLSRGADYMKNFSYYGKVNCECSSRYVHVHRINKAWFERESLQQNVRAKEAKIVEMEAEIMEMNQRQQDINKQLEALDVQRKTKTLKYMGLVKKLESMQDSFDAKKYRLLRAKDQLVQQQKLVQEASKRVESQARLERFSGVYNFMPELHWAGSAGALINIHINDRLGEIPEVAKVGQLLRFVSAMQSAGVLDLKAGITKVQHVFVKEDMNAIILQCSDYDNPDLRWYFAQKDDHVLHYLLGSFQIDEKLLIKIARKEFSPGVDVETFKIISKIAPLLSSVRCPGLMGSPFTPHLPGRQQVQAKLVAPKAKHTDEVPLGSRLGLLLDRQTLEIIGFTDPTNVDVFEIGDKIVAINGVNLVNDDDDDLGVAFGRGGDLSAALVHAEESKSTYVFLDVRKKDVSKPASVMFCDFETIPILHSNEVQWPAEVPSIHAFEYRHGPKALAVADDVIQAYGKDVAVVNVSYWCDGMGSDSLSKQHIPEEGSQEWARLESEAKHQALDACRRATFGQMQKGQDCRIIYPGLPKTCAVISAQSLTYTEPMSYISGRISRSHPTCLKSAKAANQVHEEMVVQEVGECDFEKYDDRDHLQEVIEMFFNSPLGNKHLMNLAVTVLDGSSWLRKKILGFNQSEYGNGKPELHAIKNRIMQLIPVVTRISAAFAVITTTRDEYMKASCAKQLLEAVMRAGGIFPKVAQNLALRPDIVEDTYTRDMLKATQTDNPMRSREETQEYLDSLGAEVTFGEDTVPLGRVSTLLKPVSAGSVGQVWFGQAIDERLRFRLEPKAFEKGHPTTIGPQSKRGNCYDSRLNLLDFNDNKNAWPPMCGRFVLQSNGNLKESKSGLCVSARSDQPTLEKCADKDMQMFKVAQEGNKLRKVCAMSEAREGLHQVDLNEFCVEAFSLNIIKVIFKETQKQYQNDWDAMQLLIGAALHHGKIDSTDTISIMWAALSPMKHSITDEFDLRKESAFTMRGHKMLKDVADLISQGEIEGLDPNITFTTPVGIATSSQYTMIQSVAPGSTLKDHVKDIEGNVDGIVAWRKNIFRGMLHVFGYTALQHGFWQTDPHGGNWFVDKLTNTVSLIDWGGVGNLGTTTSQRDFHCKLAQLYSTMEEVAEHHSSCEAVKVSLSKSIEKPQIVFNNSSALRGKESSAESSCLTLEEIANDPSLLECIEGEYLPGGGVLYIMTEEQNALEKPIFMQFNFAYRYLLKHGSNSPHSCRGKTFALRYDGDAKEWRISEMGTTKELYRDVVCIPVKAEEPAASSVGSLLQSTTSARHALQNSSGTSGDHPLNDSSVKSRWGYSLKELYDSASPELKAKLGKLLQSNAPGIGDFSQLTASDVTADMIAKMGPDLANLLVIANAVTTVVQSGKVEEAVKALESGRAQDLLGTGKHAMDFALSPLCEGTYTKNAQSQALPPVLTNRFNFEAVGHASPVSITPARDCGAKDPHALMEFVIKQYAAAARALNLTLKMKSDQFVLWKGNAIRVQKDTGGQFVEETINGLSKEYLQEPIVQGGRTCIEVQKVAANQQGSMKCKRWGEGIGTGYRGLSKEQIVLFSHVTVPNGYPGSVEALIAQHPREVVIRIAEHIMGALAVQISVMDSDVATALMLGLRVKESLSILLPDFDSLKDFMLLARCLMVFQGMMFDLIKSNFMKIDQKHIEALLDFSKDRFFTTWSKYANTYIAQNPDSCPRTLEWEDVKKVWQ